MKSSTSLEESLKREFPKFCQSRSFLNSFLKQQFTSNQWTSIITYIINFNQRIFTTYEDLQNNLSFYQFKNTSLDLVLIDLVQKDLIRIQNTSIKGSGSNQKKKNNTSLFNIFLPNKEQNIKNISQFNRNDKIFSKQLRKQKIQQIKEKLSHIFGDQIKCMDQIQFISELKKHLILDTDSIRKIIKELTLQNSIKIRNFPQNSLIFYSSNPNDLNNNDWNSLQTTKHNLRQQIKIFDKMMTLQLTKSKSFTNNTRQQLIQCENNSAETTLKKQLESHTKYKTIQIKKNLLQQKLGQLQQNEINNVTFKLLTQVQTVYKQTMIDQNLFDKDIQKTLQFQQTNKEINSKFKLIVENNNEQQDIQNMMMQIKRDIQKQNMPKTKQMMVPTSKKYRPNWYWTKTRDQQLMTLVKQYGKQFQWKQIKQYFPGVNIASIKKRYRNYLSPNLKRSQWSMEQDQVLMQCIIRYQKNWSQICKYIPGRSIGEIKDRRHLLQFRNYFHQKIDLLKDSKQIFTIQQQQTAYEMNKNRKYWQIKSDLNMPERQFLTEQQIELKNYCYSQKIKELRELFNQHSYFRTIFRNRSKYFISQQLNKMQDILLKLWPFIIERKFRLFFNEQTKYFLYFLLTDNNSFSNNIVDRLVQCTKDQRYFIERKQQIIQKAKKIIKIQMIILNQRQLYERFLPEQILKKMSIYQSDQPYRLERLLQELSESSEEQQMSMEMQN